VHELIAPVKGEYESPLQKTLLSHPSEGREPMTRPDISPLLLTPDQAATVLAICPRTLWSRTVSGEIPYVRIGRSVRYSPDDLNTWIENNKQEEIAQ
jgi:excisionase family DNA binding protein